MPTQREMAELAASLKNKIQQNKLRLRRAGVSSDLPAEMLQALELLETALVEDDSLNDAVADAADGSPSASLEDSNSYHLPTKFLNRLDSRIESSVESVLQPWRSNLEASTARFTDFLTSVQESAQTLAQMEKEYAERLTQIEQKRIQLAEQLAKSQALEWRLARQRKTLAQSIRAQRAEMQLELTKAKAELDQRLAEAMDEEWLRVDEETSQLRNELNAANQQIDQLQIQLKQTRESEAQSSSKDHQWQDRLAELEKQLSDTQEQLFRSANQLSEYESRLSRQEAELSQKDVQLSEREVLVGKYSAQLSEIQTQFKEMQAQLREAKHQLSEKENQLAEQGSLFEESLAESERLQKALEDKSIDEQHNGEAHISKWKSRLEQAESEITDLREQNSELATRIAHQTADSLRSRNGGGSVSPELMSWDERKKLMLQQLEQGDNTDEDTFSTVTETERMDMQQLIATTQSEIERRDREIEELREIVQLQSEARQGMAIGAAGVAQLLDNNDLINEERKKLQEIQQEWEAKLRQAEIDLSMERAKLARERSEMELELAQFKRAAAQGQNTSGSSGDKKERRWKNFMGIKEEPSE